MKIEGGESMRHGAIWGLGPKAEATTGVKVLGRRASGPGPAEHPVWLQEREPEVKWVLCWPGGLWLQLDSAEVERLGKVLNGGITRLDFFLIGWHCCCTEKSSYMSKWRSRETNQEAAARIQVRANGVLDWG